MKRLWLLFAQVCTVLLGLLFVTQTLRPDWLRLNPLGAKQSAPLSVPTPSAPTPAPTLQPAPTAGVAPTPVARAGVTSYADAVKQALPAVVSIATARVGQRAHPLADDPFWGRFFGGSRGGEPQQQMLGEGSGAIVSGEGHVLTNFHVINGANRIKVVLPDKREFSAKVIGADPETDLAVLRLNKQPAEILPVIRLAPPDSLLVGDVVLAMGNPFGISNTVTMGIVSALGRRDVNENNPLEDFIQTDAAINPGNSGGPLVDAAGHLVGINTSIYTRTGTTAGIGFSIPVAIAKPILDQIVATGEVQRGYFGASLQQITPEVARTYRLSTNKGAFIAALVNDGPAVRAGVQLEDVILEVNGKVAEDNRDVISAIANAKPGSTVSVKVLRRGETLALPVTIGKRPSVRR